MTLVVTSFLDALAAAAERAEAAERQYRQEAARRIAVFEQERAFAFRRLNLLRAVAGSVAEAESEEIAVANALAMLRAKLGWITDSEARGETVSRFAPVAQAVFRAATRPDEAAGDAVRAALEDFETWYAGGHSSPFWVLFEQDIPETPRVDF